MKKLVMLLAVLVATPVFALSIDMNDLGGGIVAIEYSDANELNLPSAFALDFTIDAPGTISLTVDSYKLDGENESGDPQAFGIYPARIVIDGNGTPTSYGTPLADPCDFGADASPTHMVLEFGALYYKDANKPGTSGTLCTLTIGGCAGSPLDLTMAIETTYRGGVLLRDGNTPEGFTENMVLDEIVVCTAVEDCMKSTASGYPAGDAGKGYDNWVLAGEPDCWCYEFQHLGDIDGKEQGSGMTLKRIGSVDVGLFVAGYGKKRAQLIGDLVCADLDHLDQGSGMTLKAVGSVDVAIFVVSYGKKTFQLSSAPYAGDYNSWIVP